jgi:hypothetical protein
MARCVCLCVWKKGIIYVGRAGLFLLCRKICGPACQIAPGILACDQCLKLSGYSAHFCSTAMSSTVVLAVSLSEVSGCGGSW